MKIFKEIDQYAHGQVNTDSLREFVMVHCFCDEKKQKADEIEHLMQLWINRYDLDNDQGLNYKELCTALKPLGKYEVTRPYLSKVNLQKQKDQSWKTPIPPELQQPIYVPKTEEEKAQEKALNVDYNTEVKNSPYMDSYNTNQLTEVFVQKKVPKDNLLPTKKTKRNSFSLQNSVQIERKSSIKSNKEEAPPSRFAERVGSVHTERPTMLSSSRKQMKRKIS